jgi:hypothetical protein
MVPFCCPGRNPVVWLEEARNNGPATVDDYRDNLDLVRIFGVEALTTRKFWPEGMFYFVRLFEITPRIVTLF